MPTIGIDLGGTKIMAVLVEGETVVEKAKKSTPSTGGPDDVLDAVAAVVAKVDPDGLASGIGIGAPGPVVPGSGVLARAGNLPGWDHAVDVAGGIARRCGGRRVLLDNDVNVGTLAEWRVGAGRGVDNMLAVFMGTGVGAGLVLDGRLRRGPRGIAGELGHTYVHVARFDPGVVGTGELEDYAGRRKMEVEARRRHAAGEPTELVDLVGKKRMKSSTWERALEVDDAMAGDIIDNAAEAMANALASAVALVDIELIVLGGGMAERLGEPFRQDLEQRLANRAFAGMTAPIRSAALGDTGGALGAAFLNDEGSADR